MSHELRPAGLGDVAAVHALIAAAYRPWVAILGQEPAPLRQDYTAMVAAGQVTVACTTSCAGDRIDGLLVLVPFADVLLIENIAVAPQAQGSGLGRRLLQHAEVRGAGYRALRLYTHQGMAANIAIYRRFGFAETHRITEHGLPRVYMEKALR